MSLLVLRKLVDQRVQAQMRPPAVLPATLTAPANSVSTAVQHAGGTMMAEAALCAHDEKKYMQFLMHVLTDDADTESFKIAQERLSEYEKTLKLNSKKYAACRASHKYLPTIQPGAAAGVTLDVRGTPSYFINGATSGGARDYPEFKALIDSELAKVTKMKGRISKNEKRAVPRR